MKRKRNMVRTIILIATVLACLMCTLIGVIGYNHIKKAYYTSFSEGLRAAAVLLDNQVTHQVEGDWSVSEDGQLLKGDMEVHDLIQGQLDDLNQKTGMHFTVFYGDTRYVTSLTDATTGMRMEGTKASDTVISEVLKGGNEYLADNVEIAGQEWYTYYLPLKNTDGTVVGMVFAGRDTSIVEANLKKAANAITLTFVIFFFFNWGVARIIITRSTRSIRDIITGLKQLEDGDLFLYIDDRTFNRRDELGTIANSTAQVRDKLQDVIRTTKELSADVTKSGVSLATSAETASNVAEQVTSAVEDISRGATSQAESVETSVNNTNEMGDSIDDITERVGELTAAASDMMTGANRTVETLNNLMTTNQGVMNSMQDINAQIRLTNDSVKDIAEASNAITAIAEQTHLLSLNASIEAARAGEYGKGFSVVATEIGNLSNQSKEAAVSIKKIVETLVGESQRSVETIEQLSEDMKAQNSQLTSTKDDMDAVVVNVNNVDNSTKMIADKLNTLNELKNKFADIMAELSAISQQNAASTEETNASMEELNATFALISDAAAELRNMAETLNEKMDYFSLEQISA
ncbi:MAG: methyl-accepting chemotaxis protein [Butyrivibrio sp.]|uniref:methyl-accepting chemotaxis protein n=1 Tax=Butyrivibrio sp. TaxID=28121 RepID=UPI0025C6461B|nr:methyl-accepting chemotaxis protein [Butyrivibrio sp.]MBQ6588262.1 methyl-accepting chemotaxis protein [Butyrivibrio sp.]